MRKHKFTDSKIIDAVKCVDARFAVQNIVGISA